MIEAMVEERDADEKQDCGCYPATKDANHKLQNSPSLPHLLVQQPEQDACRNLRWSDGIRE
jgi:hypothetical protein